MNPNPNQIQPICPVCGATNPLDAEYCVSCGANLREKATELLNQTIESWKTRINKEGILTPEWIDRTRQETAQIMIALGKPINTNKMSKMERTIWKAVKPYTKQARKEDFLEGLSTLQDLSWSLAYVQALIITNIMKNVSSFLAVITNEKIKRLDI